MRDLRDYFRSWRALEVTSDAVVNYIQGLKDEGYAPATINRRTQLLGQAFNLAIARKTLTTGPSIPHLSEKGNARTGFVFRTELDRLIGNLPDYLQDAALFAFLSRWRRNEVFSLTWPDVQHDAIRLQARNSKEKEPRFLALEGELAELIERRRKVANGPLVFHHDGKPIVDFRKAWRTAARMAGVSGKLYHDLRRSGVRDMIRSGVAPHVAMSISGHKTDSMLKRYAIIAEGDQRAAIRRTQEFRQTELDNKVVVMPKIAVQ